MRLVPSLQKSLVTLRRARKFNVEAYLRAKLRLLSDYLQSMNIDTAVVGLSGGIDSAVTVGILHRLQQQPDSPLKRVIPVLLPIFNNGATHQSEAVARARLVTESLDITPIEVDLSGAHTQLKAAVDRAMNLQGDSWAAGQLVSTTRTPALYYVTSLLTEQGMRAVVCGTTNRDEGAYTGFFGKASDGMVDIQVISDIHKSEVYAVAAHLGLPQAVINAPPSGDTFDGRCDEEMLGVSYDFLEWYLLTRCLPPRLADQMLQHLDSDAHQQFLAGARLIEQRHWINRHKYLSGSPALHFDVYQRSVPGGARADGDWPQGVPIIPTQRFLGYFELAADVQEKFTKFYTAPAVISVQQRKAEPQDSHLLLEGVLTTDECLSLKQAIRMAPRVPTNHHGKPDQLNAQPHSFRATFHSDTLATQLFTRIKEFLPPIRFTDRYSATDGEDHPVWRAVGINPVFRCITYPSGGLLVPHYDSAYDFGDGYHRTLMSVILYLNDTDESTCLVHDAQSVDPSSARDYRDHSSLADPSQVIAQIKTRAGSLFIFDHRLLHQALPNFTREDRVIVRTDIIFEKCGLLMNAFNDPFYQAAKPKLPSYLAFPLSDLFERQTIDLSQAWRWMLTPLDKLLHRLKSVTLEQQKTTRLAVLVTTGGFAPVHAGHLQMLEAAKAALEQEGVIVLGGYLAPDHDDYVTRKTHGEQYPAQRRLALCEAAVSSSDWLMVDSWQITSQTRAVNFTTVLERLTAYLAQHVPTPHPIEVTAVMGGDNARLALSFLGKGHCIIVPRQGHERAFHHYAESPLLHAQSNIRFLRTAITEPFASSRLREQDIRATPQSVQPAEPMTVYLRNEEEWSLTHWLTKIPETQLSGAYQKFFIGLQRLLSRYIQTRPPSSLVVQSLSQQREVLQRLRMAHRVISLDPCLPGDYTLAISRCYNLGGRSLLHPMVARPGQPEMATQVAVIPPGEYLLLDDDSATGATVKQALALLQQHQCHIQKVHTLIDPSGSSAYEICDARDFLVGAREGGLVMELPNGMRVRAPYVLPYVSASARLSVSPALEYAFSYHVWQLNVEFFQSIGSLLLSDADPSLQQLAYYAGFSPSHQLSDFCAWHAQQFLVNGLSAVET